MHVLFCFIKQIALTQKIRVVDVKFSMMTLSISFPTARYVISQTNLQGRIKSQASRLVIACFLLENTHYVQNHVHTMYVRYTVTNLRNMRVDLKTIPE